MGQDIEMPNALIIPIPQGQTAKKGDIVLTWWQSGSGMERAIVTDDSNPASPKVCYLDMDWKDDGKGFANDHNNEQLRPNTFTVLKNNEWQPGAQVTVNADGSYKIFTGLSSRTSTITDVYSVREIFTFSSYLLYNLVYRYFVSGLSP